MREVDKFLLKRFKELKNPPLKNEDITDEMLTQSNFRLEQAEKQLREVINSTCDGCGEEKPDVVTVYTRNEPLADLCADCRNYDPRHDYVDPPYDD